MQSSDSESRAPQAHCCELIRYLSYSTKDPPLRSIQGWPAQHKYCVRWRRPREILETANSPQLQNAKVCCRGRCHAPPSTRDATQRQRAASTEINSTAARQNIFPSSSCERTYSSARHWHVHQ